MTPLLEKVARALWQQEYPNHGSDEMWKAECEVRSTRDYWAASARSALLALSDLPEEVIEAMAREVRSTIERIFEASGDVPQKDGDKAIARASHAAFIKEAMGSSALQGGKDE